MDDFFTRKPTDEEVDSLLRIIEQWDGKSGLEDWNPVHYYHDYSEQIAALKSKDPERFFVIDDELIIENREWIYPLMLVAYCRNIHYCRTIMLERKWGLFMTYMSLIAMPVRENDGEYGRQRSFLRSIGKMTLEQCNIVGRVFLHCDDNSYQNDCHEAYQYFWKRFVE